MVNNLLSKIKSYMMPLAMVTGGLLHSYTSQLAFLTPYLIGVMLLITYSSISFKEIRFSPMHFILITIQVIGSIIVYLILYSVNIVLAQGAMICVLAPTATSAPVITGMLGGSVESLTAYSLLCNMTIVFVAPIIFAFMGESIAESFIESFWVIFQKIALLLFFPFLIAFLLQKYSPKIHNRLHRLKSLSFFLWSAGLTIITGKIVQFIIDQPNPDYKIEISLACLALIICISQFLLGRKIGSIYNETIAGGQGLGQKNTILAIWMAHTYLNPISSLAPGAYVLWQNMVNSYQVWLKRKTI